MKDYTSWHKLKTIIENELPEKLFREREIWWCSLGQNVGFEEDGKNERFERPVLVLKKFNRGMFWGLPLTSKEKDNIFHFVLTVKEQTKSSVILSQLRLLSAKRLIRRIVRINENLFRQVINKTNELFQIK